ncbi:hypothetical protein VPH35_000398 [Triticum aestivum]
MDMQVFVHMAIWVWGGCCYRGTNARPCPASVSYCIGIIKNYFRQYFNKFAVLRSPAVVIYFLAAIILVTALMGRELACVLAERGYLFGMRRVAKFTKKLPAATRYGNVASMMNGYKHPVHFVGFGSDGDAGRGLKDKCVAFSMYQLLKQRYYGMALAEECLDVTRDFFLNELLQPKGDYERAFRIVEMELGFCHDHFFTKHAVIFELEAGFFSLFLVRIFLISTVVYFVLQSALSVKTLNAIIEVQTKRADDIITLLVLATILLVEVLQAAFYLALDWCKVSLICRYVTRSCYQRSAFIEKVISCLGRFTLFGYWKNKIGLYSVSSGNTYSDLSDGEFRTVKKAIVKSLVSCDGLPTNGEGSLRRNGVLAEFSWALRGQSQAEIMLIWNIATFHFSIVRPYVEEDAEFNVLVSLSLSRYCAHLMESAPELLPGNCGDTKVAMADVQDDFSKIQAPLGLLGQAMDEFQDEEEGRSIFMRGVKLGKQLKAMPNRAEGWQIIADFWAEKILYIAPTDNVKGHMELLAKGGELLTNIWVLLTHAGVVKIHREEDKKAMPRRRPSQANV